MKKQKLVIMIISLYSLINGLLNWFIIIIYIDKYFIIIIISLNFLISIKFNQKKNFLFGYKYKKLLK